MTNKSTAISRLLAVAALGAAAVAVIVVIGSASGGGSDEPGTGQKGTPAKTQKKKARTKARKYKVKEGDSLSAIAERTGIPIEQLEQLNPDLDPQALTVGQKLKLR
ncbi:MAG: LysM domain-containing protein [Solirubrobacterales bacterium]|nr:LysM domain-containing protein [Solirubrobacterales bacterium]